MKNVILSSLLLFFFAGCGEKREISVDTGNLSYQQSVLNGVPIDTSASPQFVKLLIPLAAGGFGECTGTVIGADSILTAGHCFVGAAGGALVEHPIFGELSINSVVLHPLYREEPTLGAVFFDLAIVHTGAPVGLPALGIETSDPTVQGTNGFVFGFGISDSDAALNGGEIMADLVTPNHIFSVNQGGTEPCYGDSGGPFVREILGVDGAVLRASIAGVVSTGSQESCSKGDVTLFTNLQNEESLAFIKANVSDVILY